MLSNFSNNSLNKTFILYGKFEHVVVNYTFVVIVEVFRCIILKI